MSFLVQCCVRTGLKYNNPGICTALRTCLALWCFRLAKFPVLILVQGVWGGR